MNVAFINPFIESTLRSLDMMAGIQAEKVGLEAKEDLITTYDISSIIGITGETSGSIIISVPEGLACKIASNMLMEEITSMNKSVEDAIGEIGNIVVGDARRSLIQDGYSLNISVPTVVVGSGHVGSGRPTTTTSPWDVTASPTRSSVPVGTTHGSTSCSRRPSTAATPGRSMASSST